jgi:hypothetical protein
LDWVCTSKLQLELLQLLLEELLLVDLGRGSLFRVTSALILVLGLVKLALAVGLASSLFRSEKRRGTFHLS